MSQPSQNIQPVDYLIVPSRRGIARLGERNERQIQEFVEEIVRRTRLWPSEKNEVRVELGDHFDDGADAGHTAEQLLQSFGSPKLAAMLIRKAKRRGRPWMWHFWRRSLLACLGLACLVFMSFSLVYIRLHSAVGKTSDDLITIWDQSTKKIPESDRAWPDYRAALMALQGYKAPPSYLTVVKIATNGPRNSDWPGTLVFLDKNAKAIDLFVQGTKKPRLGYLYRDYGNNAWLVGFGYRSASEMYPVGMTSTSIMLPQIQELNFLHSLLRAAQVRALEDGKLAEFKRLWQAGARLASQLSHEEGSLIYQGTGKHYALSSLNTLRRLVRDYPKLLSDAELQAWRQEIQSDRWKSTVSLADNYRQSVQEFLQVGYTQRANGDGRLTFAGCRFLREHLVMVSEKDAIHWPQVLAEKYAAGLAGANGTNPNMFGRRSAVDKTFEEAAALRWSTTLANRKEMQQEFDLALKLLDEDCALPIREKLQQGSGSSPYLREMQRISGSPALFRRYWPVLLLLPRYDGTSRIFAPPHEVLVMHCEATLATIALEQFRRRTDQWPAKLEELVPQDLPKVPTDIYTGKPLVYRLVNGAPSLYSVFEDLKDDNGTAVPKINNTMGLQIGDLNFIPVED